MKYLFVFLLLMMGYTGYATDFRIDTGNVDILKNRALLPAAAKWESFTIRENDTLTYTLQLAMDKAGRPLYYSRNIFTPVCYTGECKPVYINFYWDLLGNYIRYDLPAAQMLTKLDHREFTWPDYEKLQAILAKDNSLLADLQITDLIVPGTEKLTDSVDAHTGATLKTIQQEVISGAVYTCYTLWHIVHGPVVAEMQRITEGYNSKDLQHRFLLSGSYAYQYWALDKVMDKNGGITPGFEKDLQDVIGGKNIFISRYILQKIAPTFFNSQQRQDWLWDIYANSVYPFQLDILRKLKTVKIRPKLTTRIAGALADANATQTGLLLSLLQSASPLPAPAVQQLGNVLEKAAGDRAAVIVSLLQQQPGTPQIKTILKDYLPQSNNR
ncbi:hypothetical protein [Chitinophaga eiseniae]|uniref:Uncharacterized protein n=1 Tax=Chitinophaga eiseniae TaxID=634771 RepID=A0A847SNN3_9BACT|nr:hypothetical protein [Chitinophaga eiseniae]NLR81443.1 hypothetical protein [Chitinophaga eiseniae]